MRNNIKRLLQRLNEVGFENFENELSSSPYIQADFKVVTARVKEMLEEENQIDEHINSGKSILFFKIKL